MRWPLRFLTIHPVRAVLEAFLVGVSLWLGLFLLQDSISLFYLQLAITLLIGYGCMLLYALRLRLPKGSWWRQSIFEATAASVLSIAFSVIELAFAFVLLRGTAPSMFWRGSDRLLLFVEVVLTLNIALFIIFRSRIELVADMPSELPRALVDASRLEQVLQNLLHNGVRHTAPGGIVAVMVTGEAEAVVLQVKDTGEGIAPSDLPHIWERFYQTESARTRMDGGTGLGLALVKEWIEGMNGTVAVESVLGEGSCFTIRLPRTDEA